MVDAVVVSKHKNKNKNDQNNANDEKYIKNRK